MVYPNIYYHHKPGQIHIDETLAKIIVQELQIAR